MENIVLIGMPGSGKSTAGVLLAKTLGYGFVDTDLILQQREGALLQSLLDRWGTDRFLEAEEAAICSVSCRQCVIAPGGSAVCREGAMEHLKSLGEIVYLHLSLEALEERISNLASRGIAMKPGETLADVYAYRAPLYRRWADYRVETDGQTLDETVGAILRTLLAGKPAGETMEKGQ